LGDENLGFERHQGRSRHLDDDLFIVHKTPCEGIAVQDGEEVFAHDGNTDAILDLSVVDLHIEGEIGVFAVIDGLELDLVEGDLLPFGYGFL
jgi:hypothetical protein